MDFFTSSVLKKMTGIMFKPSSCFVKIKALILLASFSFLTPCYADGLPPEREALNKGVELGEKGKYDEAITEFNKAIVINPHYGKAYEDRGLTYGKKGDLDQAISDFTRAVALNPNEGKTYYSRAIAFFAKEIYGSSWLDVHKAESLGYKIDPKFLEALKKASGREK